MACLLVDQCSGSFGISNLHLVPSLLCTEYDVVISSSTEYCNYYFQFKLDLLTFSRNVFEN